MRLLKDEVTNKTGGLEGSQQRVTNGNQSYHQGFQLFGIGLLGQKGAFIAGLIRHKLGTSSVSKRW